MPRIKKRKFALLVARRLTGRNWDRFTERERRHWLLKAGRVIRLGQQCASNLP